MTLPLEVIQKFKCNGCDEMKSATMQQLVDNPVYTCSCGHETKVELTEDDGSSLDPNDLRKLHDKMKDMGFQ